MADDVFAVMDKFRAALLARESGAEARLVRAYGAAYRRLQDGILALDDEIGALDDLSAAKLGKLRRWKILRAEIVGEMDKFGVILEDHLSESVSGSVRAGVAEARVMAEAALPGNAILDARIMGSWNKLPAAAVENLMGFLSEGSPLAEMLKAGLGETLAAEAEAALVEGLALGYNPRKVANILRDRLGQGLSWSLRTSRTVNLYAYREANRASYVANSRIVKGWIWRANVGGNPPPCPSCLAMDGTEHGLDERLNDHDNGRCWMEPITPSYKEMGFDVAEPKRPQRQSGREWFEAQPAGAQKKILGEARWRAWSDGEFDFSQLTTTHDHPIWGEVRTAASLKQITSYE